MISRATWSKSYFGVENRADSGEWSVLPQKLSMLLARIKRPTPLYDRARCNTPSVKTQWISDLCWDKPSSLLRILNAKEARITRPNYAKLRDASRPRDSHSIISNDFSSLICQHKFSSLTDKCRRYARPNSSVLNSQKNCSSPALAQFRYLSESIDWMARRVRNQD